MLCFQVTAEKCDLHSSWSAYFSMKDYIYRRDLQETKPGLTQSQLRIFAAEHHPMHSFVLQAGKQKEKTEQVREL